MHRKYHFKQLLLFQWRQYSCNIMLQMNIAKSPSCLIELEANYQTTKTLSLEYAILCSTTNIMMQSRYLLDLIDNIFHNELHYLQNEVNVLYPYILYILKGFHRKLPNQLKFYISWTKDIYNIQHLQAKVNPGNKLDICYECYILLKHIAAQIILHKTKCKVDIKYGNNICFVTSVRYISSCKNKEISNYNTMQYNWF